MLWLFSTQICLLVSNVHYVFLFSTPTMLLWFCWAHFLWCGCVCMNVLMDVNQGLGGDEEDKRKSYWVEWALLFFYKFLECVRG